MATLEETAKIDIWKLYLESYEQVERVLGMPWFLSTDELSFSTCMKEEVRQLLDSGIHSTKRQMLRCVMSLFDPLGLLSFFVIHGWG